jgi:hypothetical protein
LQAILLREDAFRRLQVACCIRRGDIVARFVFRLPGLMPRLAKAAFNNRQHYVQAAQIFMPLGECGVPSAQTAGAPRRAREGRVRMSDATQAK